jgi:hypothetical protein
VNWRTNIQIRDQEPTDRRELICRKCGKLRWITGSELQARKGLNHLALREVEARASCRQRGCGGICDLRCLRQMIPLGLLEALHSSKWPRS